MACHRCGTSLVACRADPSGRPVDRPAFNRGAHPAPLAGLDSPHSVSRTVQIHSPQPNLARSPARCNRGRGRALLPAPRFRLAPSPNRCRRRFRRRPHSWSFHHHAATCKEFVLRNGPLCPPQGCGVHPGYQWPNSSSASGAFWRSISTWSNGALVFMVQTRPVVTTTEPRPGISAGNKRRGWLRFFRLP